MKNHLQNFFVILLFLILDVSSFANNPPCPGCPPGTGGTDGDLEGNDVPIDGKLVWLAICGIIFAFYIFSKNSKTNVLE